MSIGGSGTPGPDAFTLTRLGRNGLRGRGGATTLERRSGDGWAVVERYPDRVAAAAALDEAIAEGASARDVRLVTAEHRGVNVLLVAGVIVLAFIVGISLWSIIS